MSREYCILVCDELLTSMCAKVFVSRRWPTGASQGVSPTTTTAQTTFLSSREHFKMEYHSYLWHRLCSPLVIMLERRSCNHCAVCQCARLYCFIFSRDMFEGLSQRHMSEGLSQRQDATGYVCRGLSPGNPGADLFTHIHTHTSKYISHYTTPDALFHRSWRCFLHTHSNIFYIIQHRRHK